MFNNRFFVWIRVRHWRNGDGCSSGDVARVGWERPRTVRSHCWRVLNNWTVCLSGERGLSIRRRARTQRPSAAELSGEPAHQSPLQPYPAFGTCFEAINNIIQLICAWTAAASECLINWSVVTRIAFTLACATEEAKRVLLCE